ncbi:MAG: permease-like cell division protein FtsX [Lachnospiraceae bacterium]|nr:permease-like cell division protein FtsX [Lachnospiraceae bacterium]
MRNINSFFYGVGQGIKNIFRNRMFSLASIGTMSACLFLFGIFYIVLSNFEYIVKSAETNVGITVFFDDGISQQRIDQIRMDISKRAEVYRVEYITAEEAWEDYKATKLSPELAETFGNDNPLENSSSLTVFLNDVSMQSVLERYIKGLEGVRKLNDSAGVADTLSGINRAITVVSAVIITVLLFVAAFLIGMTVSTGVSVRKREISIMKLIGASNYFIRIPYVVEGILIGLIGAAIPLVILRFAYTGATEALSVRFSTMLNSVTFLKLGDIMKVLVPVSLLIGVGIGYIGSSFTLKRQLKKIEEV